MSPNFLEEISSLAEMCEENIPVVPEHNQDIPRYANGYNGFIVSEHSSLVTYNQKLFVNFRDESNPCIIEWPKECSYFGSIYKSRYHEECKWWILVNQRFTDGLINNNYFYEENDYMELSEEAKTILKTPNAGGSSTRSEAYAMEFLVKYFGAKTIKDEMNIKYYHEWWKKCDFITRINDVPTGVSVTRAIFTDRYNPDDLDLKISKLLWKKLSGLVIARAGTSEESVFEQCILFVWSPDKISSNIIYNTFHYITDPSLKDGIILIIVEASSKLLMWDFDIRENNLLIPGFKRKK